jgi:hypothetical protein
LSQVRDLFFDEFYEELEKVIKGIEGTQEEPGTPPLLTRPSGAFTPWSRR